MRSLRFASLTLASLLLSAAPARAEDAPAAAIPADGAADTSDLESLLDESVISGASRGAEVAATAPATTTTITAEELRRFGVRTLDEAIDFLSLGMVNEHPLATTEINVRGVMLTSDYGNHVLLVIDGHPMNEQWGGTAYFDRTAALPIELIDHIEVILGPGSVLYGSNAMLGVINVVTKRAKDVSGLHLVLESDLPFSLRGAAGGGIEFNLLGTKAELTGQIDYYGFKGPEMMLGPQPYGDDSVTGEPKKWGDEGPYGTWGGRAVKGYYAQIPSAHLRFAVGGLQLMVRGAFSKRASPGSWGDFDNPENYELDRWFSLDLRYRRALSSLVQLSAHGYFDWYTYTQNAPSAAPEGCLEGQLMGCTYSLDGHSRWGGVELAAAFNWLDSGRLVTNLGVGGQLKYVSMTQLYVDHATGESPAIPGDYRRLEGGFYAWLEQTARISSWLNINLGARYDYDQRFKDHLSPRAALAFTPWTGGTLKAIYAEAFRGPTAFESYYTDPTWFIGSPNLRPEVVRSVELSVEQRLGTQRLQLSVFRSWWLDMVIEDVATQAELQAAKDAGKIQSDLQEASLYRNMDRLDSYGLNLALDGTLVQRFRWGFSLTWAKSWRTFADGTESSLVAAAPVFGNARISYDFGGAYPSAGVVVRYVSSRPIAGSDEAVPPVAPGGVEIRLALAGPAPYIPGLSYRLTATLGSNDQAPYSIGPIHAPVEGFSEMELSPLRRWGAALTLQYNL
ncbi:MAG TPA: TonB-dependent receptor [Myxococcales bacterium]|jgi:outer membrane receptor protein involved in Fe transport